MSIYSQYRAGLWHPYEKPMYGVLLNPYHPLARGLVGCWLFNEGGGNTVYDLSGHGNHGTLGGGTAGYCPSWTIGKFGPALKFDGTDDYVDVPDFYVNEFTIEMWIKPTFSSYPDWVLLFADWATDSDKAIHYALHSGKLSLYVSEDGSTDYGVDGQTTLPLNEWSDVAVTFKEDTIVHCLNGAVDNSGTVPETSIFDSSYTKTIGAKNTSPRVMFFNGIIAVARIYNRALSPEEEIWQLYTDPFCMFYHPLEAELLYATAPPTGIVPQAMHHYRMMREV